MMACKIACKSLLLLLAYWLIATPVLAQNSACNKTVYLTFDTGNMSVAPLVADVLKRQNVKATFFLANEKTNRGDYALDDSWKSYWQSLHF